MSVTEAIARERAETARVIVETICDELFDGDILEPEVEAEIRSTIEAKVAAVLR